MKLDLTTPAVLFPAISLLLLAYTNRFLALSALIRTLYADYKQHPHHVTLGQIRTLQRRVRMIRDMQALGVLCLLLCVVSMLLLFYNLQDWARGTFGASLVMMLGSLMLSLKEIQISIRALNAQVADIFENEHHGKKHPHPTAEPAPTAETTPE